MKFIAKMALSFTLMACLIALVALQVEPHPEGPQSEPPEIAPVTKAQIVLETADETKPSATEPPREATETTATEPETAEITTKAAETEAVETTNPPAKAKREYQIQFDRLRGIYSNEDIIGIVKIPGTVVYYPVAHHDANNEYYLERNLYKNKSSAGSICLDYENSVDRRDPNTVLYGHQMYSNSMFHTISYYADKNFFEAHRYVIFNTIYEDNVWEVFAFFKTDVSFNYIKVFFRSERDFLELAAQMKSRSLYDTGIEIKEGDRILTLSTCTNIEQDTRYVLVARMVKNKSEIPEEIAELMKSAAMDFK
jgi:sortase B